MVVTNLFGVQIPMRAEVLRNDRCSSYIRPVFGRLLGALGIPADHRDPLVETILDRALLYDDDATYESIAHDTLTNAVVPECLTSALDERATRVFSQLASFLSVGTTLDLGCGDGRLGALIHRVTRQTVLADVYRVERALDTGLPFVQITHDGPLPFQSNRFENVVLCTVLHHSVAPLHTLREAVRVTRIGGRLLIHESVFDLRVDHADARSRSAATETFLSLATPEQLGVTSFFDHFYNRCIFYSSDPSTKVPVPYNYLSPESWCERLNELGLTIERVIHFGVDLPLAPLFHTMFVARKTHAAPQM